MRRTMYVFPSWTFVTQSQCSFLKCLLFYIIPFILQEMTLGALYFIMTPDFTKVRGMDGREICETAVNLCSVTLKPNDYIWTWLWSLALSHSRKDELQDSMKVNVHINTEAWLQSANQFIDCKQYLLSSEVFDISKDCILYMYLCIFSCLLFFNKVWFLSYLLKVHTDLKLDTLTSAQMNTNF